MNLKDRAWHLVRTQKILAIVIFSRNYSSNSSLIPDYTWLRKKKTLLSMYFKYWQTRSWTREEVSRNAQCQVGEKGRGPS